MDNSREIQRLVEEFKNRPYLTIMGRNKLAKQLKADVEDVVIARKLSRSEYIKPVEVKVNNEKPVRVVEKLNRKPLSEYKNILIIGDTHLPYEKEGYLEFCQEQYQRFGCDSVVHVGDLIDSHATSHHPSVPEAYSSGDELAYTIQKLKAWYKAFPDVSVCYGNHDLRSFKIGAENGIAAKWMKGFAEVLEVPNWTFEESFEINDVTYIHGTGTTGAMAAKTRALNIGQSVVMGHLHTEASIIYHQLRNKTIFGMLTGCGVSESSYGMNYAKNFPRKSIISCGIMLEDQPILVMMK